MKIICDRMGIDIYDVIRAAATKPFGFTASYISHFGLKKRDIGLEQTIFWDDDIRISRLYQ